MRRAAWAVVAAVGLSACTGAAKTSTSTQTTRPSTVATTPATSGTPTSTASGPAATTASPTGGTAAAGTRADYLAQAKPICETATKIIDALPDPGNNQDENLKILDQRAAAPVPTSRWKSSATCPWSSIASDGFFAFLTVKTSGDHVRPRSVECRTCSVQSVPLTPPTRSHQARNTLAAFAGSTATLSARW